MDNTHLSNPHFLPEFYPHLPMYPTRTAPFNLNQNDIDSEPNAEPPSEQNDAAVGEEKEPMFEKPLTPSDVGKLNRLVIPKQHAEKYFPLGGGIGGDSADKGLLLSFEDELGKFWRFRYSYWNSSQSYVLTKGWSRYVKEKRLDAGDVVLFERHRRDADRLFIGWRRRAVAQDNGGAQEAHVSGGLGVGVVESSSGGGEGSSGGWTRMFYSAHPYPTHHHPHSQQHNNPSALPYQPDSIDAGSPVQSQTTPVGTSRILRLFGVNLECQPEPDESEPSTPDGSCMSSQGQAQQHQFYPTPAYYSDHMDFTFSRDVKPMRNRRG
ncbi:hypothetical protein UlMin_005468 [Ulmus minor]